MTKFHINEKGEAGPCEANNSKCPFGGESGFEDHFTNLKEAKAVAEVILTRKYGAFQENKTVDMRKHHAFGNIDAETEMDSTFSISAEGSVSGTSNGVYTPEIYYHEDGTIDGINGWQPVSGFSGQSGYSGALMHSSEIMSGSKMEEHVRSNSGTYAIVQPANGDYTPMSEDDEDYNDYEDNMFVDGWMLLKKVDNN